MSFNFKNKKVSILTILIVIPTLICLGIGITMFHKYKKKPISQEKPVSQVSQEPSIQIKPKYVPVKKFKDTSGKKIAYLTFDDGPSQEVTPEVLNILKKNNIYATFFLIGNMAERYPNLVKQEAESGNKIGLHTYSHNYNYIYNNSDNLITDINKEQNILKNILGNDFYTKLFRFPGGACGRKPSFQQFKDSVTKLGYTYIDWNALDGDAEKIHPSEEYIKRRIQQTVLNQPKLVILMHDASSKKVTVDNLQWIIDYVKSKGYEFDTLTEGDSIK